MSFPQFDDSEDNHFLRGIESPYESNNMLQDLCKVESDPLQEYPRPSVNEQMVQQAPAEPGDDSPRKKGKRSPKDRGARSQEKKKIFYRDKMAELMREGDYIKQEYNYVAATHFEQGHQPISKEEQLKRNRTSAKNSRQRKKEYITILEQKNEEHLRQIEELTAQLQQVTLQRDRLKQDHHAEIKNFYKSKAQAYERLDSVISSPLSQFQHIEVAIQDMLVRFGTSGSERISVTNYYMNEIIEVLISDIHKYFLNSSGFICQGISPHRPPKPIDLEVMRLLDLDLPKVTKMMQQYRQRFTQQTSVFKSLTQELYRIFKSIENQGKVIELVFKDLMKDLDRKRLGQLILWFEEHKFSKEMKRVRTEWTSQLKSGEEEHECIRKQTKL